jgi:hypothetical protein
LLGQKRLTEDPLADTYNFIVHMYKVSGSFKLTLLLELIGDWEGEI